MLYSFTAYITGIATDAGDDEDALFEAGCTDALIAVVSGKMRLDFDREAPSYDAAVASALRNVQKAGGEIVRVDRIYD
jgi:hypothetical protein